MRRLVAETRLSVDDLVAPLFVADGLERAAAGRLVAGCGPAHRRLAHAARSSGWPPSACRRSSSSAFPAPRTRTPPARPPSVPTASPSGRCVRCATPSATAGGDGRLLPRRVHRPRPLRRGRPGHRRGRQRRHPAPLRRAGREPGGRRSRRDRPERDDGRAGGRHPARPSTIRDSPRLAILAYAAKYASALYGPFREAADVSIAEGGDRKGYQQDPRNRREALRRGRPRRRRGRRHGHGEAGPDLPRRHRRRARRRSTSRWRAYHVSGEYAMVKAAAERGWIDGPARGPRADHRGQAGRRRLRPHLLRRRAGRGARWLSAPASAALFERALEVIPGGVNSPVRSFRSGGRPSPTSWPVARGLRLGRRRQPPARLRPVLRRHPSSVTPILRWSGPWPRPPPGARRSGRRPKVRSCLAEAICSRVEGCEQVRLVSSGTEAAMSAIRVARGFTGRSRIVKFAGLLPRALRRAAGRRRQRASPPSACPTRPACPQRRWPRRWSCPTTGYPSSTSGWPASSSRRWRPTWAWWRPSTGSWPGCAPPVTLRGRCSSSTR